MNPSNLMAASGGIQAVGDIATSQSQAAAAGYNAKIAGMNATLATQNAQWTGAEGEQAVGIAGLKSQQQQGAIKTAQAANNVDVNTGSAKEVQKSQAEMSMLNEMNIRSNAARTAYGFETNAVSDTAQANLDRSEASNDKTAGYFGAGASLLGSVGKASAYTDMMNSKSVFPDASADMQSGSSVGAEFMSQAYPNSN